jgi:hypothetical protein
MTALMRAPPTFWACPAAAALVGAGKRRTLAFQPEVAALTPMLPRTAT